MAFKMSKEQKITFIRLKDEAGKALKDLTDMIEVFNAVFEEAREFRDELVEQWEEEYGDKSEKWQEGDRGIVVQEFIEQWKELDLDEPDFPDTEALVEAFTEAPPEPEFD